MKLSGKLPSMASSCQNRLADELTIGFAYCSGGGLGSREPVLEHVLATI
jgi:hypothetical protein